MIQMIIVRILQLSLIYVIPCNCMMEALDTFNKKLIKSIYRKKLIDGDIKIVPKCINKTDFMFIKFPFRNDNTSKEKFIKSYKSMISIISMNNYKKVLIPDILLSKYGYPSIEEKYILNHIYNYEKLNNNTELVDVLKLD